MLCRARGYSDSGCYDVGLLVSIVYRYTEGEESRYSAQVLLVIPILRPFLVAEGVFFCEKGVRKKKNALF